MIKYFCDCCYKEMKQPIDYVDMQISKCHMFNYDIKTVHFIICSNCRKKMEERYNKYD